MLRYSIKRIMLASVTLFVILSLTFILVKYLPANTIPIDLLMEEGFDVDEWEKLYGFNQPVWEQYVLWVRNVFTRWDWGVSMQMRRGVGAFEVLMTNMPTTIRLNLIAFFISMPLGFALGILAALRKNKPLDHVISFFVMLFISIPSFVIVTLLMYYLGYKLGLFPIQYPPSNVSVELMYRGMVIPVLALSFGPIAGLTRYTRAELTEVLTSEFLLLARTKGLNKRQSVLRHALRNSMVPLVGIVIGNLVGIIGGSVIIERIYGVVGVGEVFLKALETFDYNVIMVTLAFYTSIGLIATLLVDISYGIVDPRIRMGARK
ncbi:MAG: ABC transporter permease [Candidatus Izemoplasmatales bacterium]|nr:ABC transporter permease [bacterium]MDZ4196953.1 ABC transporter permease [Candidatus Izemoplasmatales bacterium]